MTAAGPDHDRFEVAVVGAGFGGLATALDLATGGARVVLFEALDYPGGCAATFHRDGYAFEAGATLFSGFGETQLFGRWIRQHRLPVELDWIDPLVTFRVPGLTLQVGRDREEFIEQLCRLPEAPVARIRRFFAWQRRIADQLWELIDDPTLLPPLSCAALLRHLARLPRQLPLLRLLGRTLESVLTRFGIQDFAPLRVYLDGLCQITVQCPAAEAEAPFALAVLDYYWRGTAHVRGGIGRLGAAIVDAIRRSGGTVRMPDRVHRIAADGEGFRIESRAGVVRARTVVANVLPTDLFALAPDIVFDQRPLERMRAGLRGGFGAAMLYLVARAPLGASPEPHHLELVADSARPLTLGNHVFVSISGERDEGRAPPGLRTLTLSTHVPRSDPALADGDQAAFIAGVQQQMRATFEQLAPEWATGIVHALTASPRTFERFTRRGGGAVGGIPRRAGLRQYLDLRPSRPAPGFYLVGDSTFLGQSILAAAVSGTRVAAAIRRGGASRSADEADPRPGP